MFYISIIHLDYNRLSVKADRAGVVASPVIVYCRGGYIITAF